MRPLPASFRLLVPVLGASALAAACSTVQLPAEPGDADGGCATGTFCAPDPTCEGDDCTPAEDGGPASPDGGPPGRDAASEAGREDGGGDAGPAAPRGDDGLKNGDESDVDCGGTTTGAPKCAVDKACNAHGDCASDGCGYDKKCVARRSCAPLAGGRTCGGADGNGVQEDCCASATAGPYTVDKYLVTAGRMRAMVERLNGNVKAWAEALPAAAGWNAAWSAELPQTIDEANIHLGSYYGKRSCESASPTNGVPTFGGHTYWTPKVGGDFSDFDQATLDQKALNCVPWWMLKAFCIWDGGHLATLAELRYAFTNGGTTKYPWGAANYVPSEQDPRIVAQFSYATPNAPALRFVSNNAANGPADVAFYIAPPGRRPLGNNSFGMADVAGNLLEFVGDRDRQFVWNASWERHGQEANGFTPLVANDIWSEANGAQPWVWGTNIGTGRPGDGRQGGNGTQPGDEAVGYYALGGRCAR